ncbi:hypothetical protein QAD02_007416 [Eretmocerus hayati]|uniref:Uncharacterized protein n=1 Tax=Eretmocerus hayati TaxID=131215 RepID=A0ACC2N3I2_9HYME|nr:hypothetical protein QAD02_007416 [Eretmocerus hayati]
MPKGASSPRSIPDDDEDSDEDERIAEAALSNFSGGRSADSGFGGLSAPRDLNDRLQDDELSPGKRKLSEEDERRLEKDTNKNSLYSPQLTLYCVCVVNLL